MSIFMFNKTNNLKDKFTLLSRKFNTHIREIVNDFLKDKIFFKINGT